LTEKRKRLGYSYDKPIKLPLLNPPVVNKGKLKPQTIELEGVAYPLQPDGHYYQKQDNSSDVYFTKPSFHNHDDQIFPLQPDGNYYLKQKFEIVSPNDTKYWSLKQLEAADINPALWTPQQLQLWEKKQMRDLDFNVSRNNINQLTGLGLFLGNEHSELGTLANADINAREVYNPQPSYWNTFINSK